MPARSSAPGEPTLRDPPLAAILAWLIPGAGHWYQGRRSKAVLFFICIVGTFMYGLWIGEWRVVYASWGPQPEQKRLPFFCQAGIGAAAIPALYQAKKFSSETARQEVEDRKAKGFEPFGDRFMVPPKFDPRVQPDELDVLNKRLHRRFELGTVYTMVAGLLNVLVIFDALGGPAYGFASRKEREERDKAAESNSQDDDHSAPETTAVAKS